MPMESLKTFLMFGLRFPFFMPTPKPISAHFHWIPTQIEKLIQGIGLFSKEDFDLRSYGWTAVFLTIAASLNYYFTFDDTYLEPLAGTWQGKWGYFLFYGFAWFSVSIPLLWTLGKKRILLKPQFWIRSVFFIGVIGIDGGMSNVANWLDYLPVGEIPFWIKKVASKLESVVLWVPVLYVFMKWNEPKLNNGLYGIRWHFEDLKPFLSMLWVMVPLIAIASFLPDFQRQYPIYQRIIDYLPFHGAEHWIGIGLYEISYLLSFISVELMFRGALVIGMSSLLGRHAILPMVSTYMFLHFGKPAGEAISSVFGGYILGVLAFQNRNIWGGIFIHTCVAFLMDMAATTQSFFRSF